jgi:hypothetical protein
VNCEAARLAIGAAPRDATPALDAHLAECVACARFRDEMRTLETRIEQAVALHVPPSPSMRPRQPAPPAAGHRVGRDHRRRAWALAAGVVLAFGLGVVLWTGRPATALAAAVVEHVMEEPDSWTQSAAVPDSTVAFALRTAGVSLDPAAGEIVYAHSCWFRGRFVPHLVVRTASQPVTVLVLAHESVPRRTRFTEQGYRGVLWPAGPGAIAVIARDDADLEEAAARVLAAMNWKNR